MIVVRLAFKGSCKSCPSSAVTLELAVQDAVRAAAPEISSIEVVAAEATTTPASVIPAESLLAHVHSNGHGPTAWHPAPELAELAARRSRGLRDRRGNRAGLPGRRPDLRLPGPLPGVRRLAGRFATARAACCAVARCGTDFDVVHAGAAAAGGSAAHLDPIPLLTRDGVLSVALRAEAMGAPA